MSIQKETPRIKLIIESTAGSIERFYNLHEKIYAVKVSAMAELHMDPLTARNYGLFIKGQNEPLPEDRTLGELGITNGMTLVISPLGAEVIQRT
jgi:hypothetical protein